MKQPKAARSIKRKPPVKIFRFTLTHARHEPIHCLAPGLFRSIESRERKSGKLSILYKLGVRKQIEFSGPEPLGANDLRVLQGLVAMSGPYGKQLLPEPSAEAAVYLREKMEAKWDAVQDVALMIRGSYSTLAKEIGVKEGGKQYNLIRASIERLWKVSIIFQDGNVRLGFRLLSHYASDDASGQLCVGLNPLIARAVADNGQHVRIEMSEVRQIKGDVTRLIHQRLCGWINHGKSGNVAIDTLCGYVWPDEANKDAMRKRRERVRSALLEMEMLGWHIKEYARGRYTVGRPKAAN